MNPDIKRLIDIATPLWAGEAEVVRTYWTSPKRTLETDLLWLRRQCFKEFWGSGVGKYDRGGVVPGQIKRLAEKVHEVDVSMDRHEFLEVLEGMKAEYTHYCAFADVHDAIRPAGTPKIDPNKLEPWPEEDALTALRFKHQAEHGALGMRACKFTEGGYCTLYSEGAKLKGRPGVDGRIGRACQRVYDDEFGHMMYGVVGMEINDLTAADWDELIDVTCQILKLRLTMRNAQFSHPLTDKRIAEIVAGQIEPIAFDYDRAETYLQSAHAAAAE